MRSIGTIIERHERIWFSIKGEAYLGKVFLQDLSNLGFKWVNGREIDVDEEAGRFMGINTKSRTIGYVSWQIWRASWLSEEAAPNKREQFYSDRVVPLRIEYDLFVTGNEDYLVKQNIVKTTGGFTYPVGGRVIYTNNPEDHLQ